MQFYALKCALVGRYYLQFRPVPARPARNMPIFEALLKAKLRQNKGFLAFSRNICLFYSCQHLRQCRETSVSISKRREVGSPSNSTNNKR